MAIEPVGAGISLADKIFSFFTGEKWDEIRKRREGERLKADCKDCLEVWANLQTPAAWKALKDAEKKLSDWSNAQ